MFFDSFSFQCPFLGRISSVEAKLCPLTDAHLTGGHRHVHGDGLHKCFAVVYDRKGAMDPQNLLYEFKM